MRTIVKKYAILILISFGLTACQTLGEAPSSLYDKLGGSVGVTAIVEGTLAYTLEDKRIAHTFENSNIPRVEALVIEQICSLTGGPCEYTGQTMERSHRGLGLTSFHFNAFVENMQKAMNDNNVPFATQNKLLAILAPMHRDVVTQ